MSRIVFFQGVNLDALPVAEPIAMIRADRAADRLRELRESWQAVNPDLTQISASVGLLLVDFADLLELTGEQRALALGELVKV